MDIKRDILTQFLKWKESDNRKPLIIRGARQIGKSWAMRKFGEQNYRHVAFFNFDNSPELCAEFERTKDPKRIIDILGLYTDVPIIPYDTLIIFDEIQECNKALNALKYFYEVAPEYHIMAAGSLLGVSLSKGDSFPVGKVNFIDMYPVTFREFLREDNPQIYQYFENLKKIGPLPEIVMGKAFESYQRYQICGGMPEATSGMLENVGVGRVVEIQDEILTAYSLDFAKHAPTSDIPKISAIWKSLPSQLARENRKFVYKLVKEGARGREYEDALLWMQSAGLIERIFCISKPGLPISAYDDMSAFKVYLCDAGLLRALSQIPPEVFLRDASEFKEFRGAMTENRVLQSLLPQLKVKPRYWVSGATAEVDFIIQDELRIIPIEVKSGISLTGKSLKVYNERYSPEFMIRFSMNNLRKDGNILNIPLFLADWTKKIIPFATTSEKES